MTKHKPFLIGLAFCTGLAVLFPQTAAALLIAGFFLGWLD